MSYNFKQDSNECYCRKNNTIPQELESMSVNNQKKYVIVMITTKTLARVKCLKKIFIEEHKRFQGIKMQLK